MLLLSLMTNQPHWKRLESKKLLDHPRVPLREDRVQLPNGNETQYAVMELADAVTVIIRQDDAFLLNLEYAYPVDDTVHRPNDVTSDGWLFKFPGGMLQMGESYTQAAIREVKEETGLEIGQVKLLGAVRNFFPRSNSRDYKVLAEITDAGQANRDAEEAGMSQVWKTGPEINALIAARDPRVMHSHFLDAWHLYQSTLHDTSSTS